MSEQKKVSEIDDLHQRLSREHVRQFREQWIPKTGRILEIGPEHDIHPGADTLGLNKGCTFVEDICDESLLRRLGIWSYNCILCFEVLEHTVDPETAMQNIDGLLRPGGTILASTPFNFRIHGPQPDCWRFTEHGLRVLFRNFDNVVIEPLNDPDRFLMPIHYNIRAKKTTKGYVSPREVKFEWIK